MSTLDKIEKEIRDHREKLWVRSELLKAGMIKEADNL